MQVCQLKLVNVTKGIFLGLKCLMMIKIPHLKQNKGKNTTTIGFECFLKKQRMRFLRVCDLQGFSPIYKMKSQVCIVTDILSTSCCLGVEAFFEFLDFYKIYFFFLIRYSLNYIF